jgi:hypothetical protein
VAFTIGTVAAVGDPVSFKANPDDRAQNIPCITGTYAEDLGYNAEGLTYNVTLIINESDWATLLGYRTGGTRPAIVDHRGNSLGGRLFKITGWTMLEGLAMRSVDLELLKAN